jgi:hypothetical protein
MRTRILLIISLIRIFTPIIKVIAGNPGRELRRVLFLIMILLGVIEAASNEIALDHGAAKVKMSVGAESPPTADGIVMTLTFATLDLAVVPMLSMTSK